MLKLGTKLCTLVHDQNFHSIIVFEPELSQCGEGLGSCDVLPAGALVVTCPMTDDVWYFDWVFLIQRIPKFHRVGAANLIETVTFRQSCCRLSTFERTLYPSDKSPSAATISQGTTEFSNCWVSQVDVGSQQLSLLCGRWGFLIHFSFRRLVCAIKFFNQIWFSVRSGNEGFQRCHELLISCVAQSLCKLHGVAGSFTLYHSFQQMEKLFAVQRSFSGYRFLLNVLCHRELIGPHASTLHGRKVVVQPGPGPHLSEIPSEPSTPFPPVQCFERQILFLGKCILGICQEHDRQR